MSFVSDIVLGTSFGDEGKGKIVYSLLKQHQYQLCIRFNGSGNAGHTVYLDDGRIAITHQLPVGILCDGVQCLISSDCLVDIERLKQEIADIESLGFQIKDRLFISEACHIITDDAIAFDRANNKIGTTGSGIGPTYSKKMLRTGIRVADKAEEIIALGATIVNMRDFWRSTRATHVLLEGAQGFELDINWTANYPYCTSSTCGIAGAINTGIPLRSIRHVYGIAKAYDTYVGTMEFQPVGDEMLEKIGKVGKEFGATTGRKRQCNYLNLNNLLDALKYNSCTVCVMNKCDVLQEVDYFCVILDKIKTEFSTWEVMRDWLTDRIRMAIPGIQCVFLESPSYSPIVVSK